MTFFLNLGRLLEARFVTIIQEMLGVRVASSNLGRSFNVRNILKINKVSLKGHLSSTVAAATPPHNPATERKMTALELQHLARKGNAVQIPSYFIHSSHDYVSGAHTGKKLAMVTAYDYPSVSLR